MTWIKTIPIPEAGEKLLAALDAQASLYPPEYAAPVHAAEPREGHDPAAGIVMSHSLLPDALRHAFSTFGALMSPDLPLERRHHEMIAATVSALNRCHY
jgi:alkylhydroperoxidase family enzyme